MAVLVICGCEAAYKSVENDITQRDGLKLAMGIHHVTVKNTISVNLMQREPHALGIKPPQTCFGRKMLRVGKPLSRHKSADIVPAICSDAKGQENESKQRDNHVGD